MDILLENKDFYCGENGKPVLINGMEETIQRCKIALTVQKGSFIYDKTFGSELHLMKTIEPEQKKSTAELLVKEALLCIPQVQVIKAEIVEDNEISCAIHVQIQAYNQLGSFEVMI